MIAIYGWQLLYGIGSYYISESLLGTGVTCEPLCDRVGHTHGAMRRLVTRASQATGGAAVSSSQQQQWLRNKVAVNSSQKDLHGARAVRVEVLAGGAAWLLVGLLLVAGGAGCVAELSTSASQILRLPDLESPQP